jgi:hypothetical protein
MEPFPAESCVHLSAQKISQDCQITSGYKFVSFLVHFISLSRSHVLQDCLCECEFEQRIVNPVKKSISNKIVQNILQKLFIISGVFRCY